MRMGCDKKCCFFEWGGVNRYEFKITTAGVIGVQAQF